MGILITVTASLIYFGVKCPVFPRFQIAVCVADTRGLACLVKFLKNSTIPAVFLVCNCDKLPTLPISLRSLILYHFQIPLLTEEDRKSIIMHEVDESNLIDTVAITQQTTVNSAFFSEFTICFEYPSCLKSKRFEYQKITT